MEIEIDTRCSGWLAWQMKQSGDGSRGLADRDELECRTRVPNCSREETLSRKTITREIMMLWQESIGHTHNICIPNINIQWDFSSSTAKSQDQRSGNLLRTLIIHTAKLSPGLQLSALRTRRKSIATLMNFDDDDRVGNTHRFALNKAVRPVKAQRYN